MRRVSTQWVAGQHGYIRAVGLLACGILTAASTGCRRKAPGPEECVLFAKAWVERRHAEKGFAASDQFDELVRDCLTTPYDRALVECVLGAEKAPDRCRVEYARRVEERREESAR